MTDQEILNALRAAEDSVKDARRCWAYRQYGGQSENAIGPLNKAIDQAILARDAILESLKGAKNL